MNKWLSLIGASNLENHQSSRDIVDNAGNILTLSTMSSRASCIPAKKSYIKIRKEEELKSLIKNVSAHYGDDNEQILAGYINDVIKEWSHDLEAALLCFRELFSFNVKEKSKKAID